MIRSILAGFAILAGLAIASPALASATHESPAVKVVANDNQWHFTTRPGTIYVGQGGAPVAEKLRWSSWTGSAATAHGTLLLQDPNCTTPSYLCKVFRYKLTVWLHRVATHKGTKYFSRMRYSYGHKGGVIYFAMGPDIRFGNGFWSER